MNLITAIIVTAIGITPITPPPVDPGPPIVAVRVDCGHITTVYRADRRAFQWTTADAAGRVGGVKPTLPAALNAARKAACR